MDKFTSGAVDALQQYEESAKRRTLFPPAPPAPMGEPWRPMLTAQERAAHDQYVKEHNLPF